MVRALRVAFIEQIEWAINKSYGRQKTWQNWAKDARLHEGRHQKVQNDALAQWHLKLLTSIRFIATHGMPRPGHGNGPFSGQEQRAMWVCVCVCMCRLNVAHCGILRIRRICRVWVGPYQT